MHCDLPTLQRYNFLNYHKGDSLLRPPFHPKVINNNEKKANVEQ